MFYFQKRRSFSKAGWGQKTALGYNYSRIIRPLFLKQVSLLLRLIMAEG
jgi:hypothetical protein